MTAPLRYLIGLNYDNGWDGTITEVGFDAPRRPACGFEAIKYCNLFNEKFSSQSKGEREYLGPYLHMSSTAVEYNEGMIDPTGPGWKRNLISQFTKAVEQQFIYIELDNPDAYDWPTVQGAIELAATFKLKVIAKNPGLMANQSVRVQYLKHPNIFGAIIEKGGVADTDAANALRVAAGKPDLPMYFVGWGAAQRKWIKDRAFYIQDRKYQAMGATWSPSGEYTDVVHIVRPT